MYTFFMNDRLAIHDFLFKALGLPSILMLIDISDYYFRYLIIAQGITIALKDLQMPILNFRN